MTTKITIDPQLVREVLGINEEVDIISPLAHNDKWISVSYCDGSGTTVYNIYEFKDLAIEWCAGKGYQFREEIWGKDKGYIAICDEDDIRKPFYYPNSDYPDKLSAELAAIDFVYKQIQKEKNTLIAINPSVAIGLRQQGKLDMVESMLKDGKSWDEIGKEIGWCPITAEKWYNMEQKEKK